VDAVPISRGKTACKTGGIHKSKWAVIQ
jgi:hypothetical protein